MITTVGHSRRSAMVAIVASGLLRANQQNPPELDRRPPHLPPDLNEDTKLPNGKSQKDAIAKQNHEEALKDADDLIALAQALKTELQKAGDYVVPVASVKKTEEIEKLARRIRGRLRS